MATFSTKKMPDRAVPNAVGSVTTVFHKIDPATLASFPAATDIIEFFKLPKGSRITNANLRVSADIGAATSTVQLRARAGATVALTAALAATAAGGAVMNTASPAVDTANDTEIDVLVGTAALDAAGDIEVMVQYINP